MNKLTQKEATDLIQKAWSDVEKYSRGCYRFGQSLYNLIPNELIEQYKDFDEEGNYGFGENFYAVDFYYEQNPDIVLEKFYKFFVEEA